MKDWLGSQQVKRYTDNSAIIESLYYTKDTPIITRGGGRGGRAPSLPGGLRSAGSGGPRPDPDRLAGFRSARAKQVLSPNGYLVLNTRQTHKYHIINAYVLITTNTNNITKRQALKRAGWALNAAASPQPATSAVSE